MLLLFTGCSNEKDLYDPNYASQVNAQTVFGTIDQDHDWNSTVQGSVTINVDAPLKTIAKVQILTESPFLNDYSKVLAEANVQKGQLVTLDYVAPNVYSRLIAACVDNDGHYYIQGFNIGETMVSFQSAASRAATRSTRAAADDYPTASALKLEFKNSTLSFNAMRTRLANDAAATGNEELASWTATSYVNLWANAGWQDERLWVPTATTSTGSRWTIVNGAIRCPAAAMTEGEIATLDDMFGDFLQRQGSNSRVTWGRKDNREYIRNSDAVKLYNNELTADGTTPMTVTPIWMPSSEIKNCQLYFYYYDPAAIPAGTTEADYIKSLPKFKAVHCSDALSAANNATDYAKGDEYLLPYYGEPADIMPQPVQASSFSTTDGKLYRMRVAIQRYGEDYYLSYTGSESKHMLHRYDDSADNVAYQLWQVFTTADGYQMLYNVGAQKFLTWSGSWDALYSDDATEVQSKLFRFEEGGRILRYNQKDMALGVSWEMASKINNMYSVTDKKASSGDSSKWIFEEYEGAGVQAVSDATVYDNPTTITAQALAIPKGYKVGFMLRKVQGNQSKTNDAWLATATNGCCYGFGSLNVQINQFPGHFSSGTVNSNYNGSVETDDPRAAIFSGNGRTYISFEDGSDCQYNDLVFEVGGYDTNILDEAPEGSEEKGNGVENYLGSEGEVEGATFTVCYEDRPNIADYDLNDLVVRVTLIDQTHVKVTVIACGALDEIYLRGVNGSIIKDNEEVHQLFGLTSTGQTVNTSDPSKTKAPIVDVMTKAQSETLLDVLKRIYVYNASMENSIRLPEHNGEAPCAIIVPTDFAYPLESVSIIDAYPTFLNWAHDASVDTDWYTKPATGKVFVWE